MSASDVEIHPTAVVDQGVTIGAGTRVWHFCHLSTGAVIGRHCSFGQNCYVAGTVVIGDNVKVQNNVSIYDGVVLEDDVFCGPSMVFTNVSNPRSAVARKDAFEKTVVGRGASIGANATIVCGVSLGEHCFIGAGAVVREDVPPFALVVGVPGRVVGWMSRHGSRLEFDEAGHAICEATGERYVLRDGSVRPEEAPPA